MERVVDRVFLPYQVGLEFFRHREGTIAEQINAFDAGRKLLNQMPLEFQKKLTRHPSIPIEKISEALTQVVNQCVEFINDSQPAMGKNFLSGPDPILSRLNDIFRDSSQPALSDDELKAAQAFVQDRFEKKLAPCFTSSKSEINPHQSDGIVWYQILEHAREAKKPIIFVTADENENWWRKSKTGNNETAIGPHFQLIKDIRMYAGEHFLMYTQDAFLRNAENYVETKTTPEAVEESRRLRESDADANTAKTASVELEQMSDAELHSSSAREDVVTPRRLRNMVHKTVEDAMLRQGLAPTDFARWQDDAKYGVQMVHPHVLAALQALKVEAKERARMVDDATHAFQMVDPSVRRAMQALEVEAKQRARMLDDATQMLQPRQELQQLEPDSPEAP